MLSFFRPKWKKQGLLIIKGSQKFVNYRRDLLAEEKLTAIESHMDELRKAIRSNAKATAEQHATKLTELCNFSAGMGKTEASLAENTEVIFVAIAIALALRAYVVQPFRIPTGSMQPTLNGIRGFELDKTEWPSFVGRSLEWAVKGRSYREFTLPEKDTLTAIAERNFLFFTWTELHFARHSKVKVSGSSSALINDLGLGKTLLELQIPPEQRTERMVRNFLAGLNPPANGIARLERPVSIPAGTQLFSGFTQSGDLILVDKFSYHFRKPERGEVFVFDTRDIEGTFGPNADQFVRMGRQAGGEHYIKRLAGVPGDTLEIRAPEAEGSQGTLFVNGKKARGVGFDKVHSAAGEYKGYLPVGRLAPGESARLQEVTDPMLDQYLPLGDNSMNSLDGRYWKVNGQWEAVHGYNLVGPAWISLWPITDHWGLIK